MSNIFDDKSKIWNRSLEDIMSESFGKYAKYIIQDRALPDIRDGLKPVQRRILYAMNELKINYDKPYKKSARTVGEVIGKYHPHGDSSIYEAMVRMSQEWKNNVPLLDMQGNKGSLDGDGPAAMRYTECRLSLFGQLMMEDIEKQTVKFIPNFDDSENEPSILPSLIPNVLINGSTGIAAGYATNVPPFNLSEVLDGIIYRIKHNNCSIKEIASIIKGPDFPTGGIIQGKEGILDVFATGKGKFNIRAKIEEVNRPNKKTKQLIVTEIPYETNKANIVKSIEELRINNELPGLKEVRDDSDKNGVSIVMEFDTNKDLEIIKNFLYKKTQLQISYSANIILINNRKPCQATIIDIIDAYLMHANEVIIKAANFELNKALNRKEILEGLIKAIKDIDNLVNLIKSSNSKDEAKSKLMEYFELTEKQAEAVVQLRLYVLTSYDTQKLIDEYNELLDFIDIKQKLIQDQEYRNEYLIGKLKEFDKKLGYRRRSRIEDEIEEIAVVETDIIDNANGVCIVTRDNYIKFIKDETIETISLDKYKFKDGDIPVAVLSLSTLDTLVCITSKSKAICIPAHKIKFTKAKDNGIHINEIVTIDSFEKTILAFKINKQSDTKTEVFVATKNSLVKRFLIEDLTINKNAKAISCGNLKNDDEIINAFINKKKYREIIAITKNGIGLRYMIDEVPIVGRTAGGVKNINLKDNDSIAVTIPVEPEESFVILVSNRGGKRIHFDDIALTSRANVGKRILTQVDSNPYLIHSGFMIGGRETIFILDTNQKSYEKRVSDIPITDANSRMNSFGDIKDILKASYVKKDNNFVNSSTTDNFEKLIELKQEKLNAEIEEENSNDIRPALNKLISKKIPLHLDFSYLNIQINDSINSSLKIDNINDNLKSTNINNQKEELLNLVEKQKELEQHETQNHEVINDNVDLKENDNNQVINQEIENPQIEENDYLDNQVQQNETSNSNYEDYDFEEDYYDEDDEDIDNEKQIETYENTTSEQTDYTNDESEKLIEDDLSNNDLNEQEKQSFDVNSKEENHNLFSLNNEQEEYETDYLDDQNNQENIEEETEDNENEFDFPVAIDESKREEIVEDDSLDEIIDTEDKETESYEDDEVQQDNEESNQENNSEYEENENEKSDLENDYLQENDDEISNSENDYLENQFNEYDENDQSNSEDEDLNSNDQEFNIDNQNEQEENNHDSFEDDEIQTEEKHQEIEFDDEDDNHLFSDEDIDKIQKEHHITSNTTYKEEDIESFINDIEEYDDED